MTECPICYETTHNNTKLVCDHTFCKNCVKEWLMKSDSDDCTCPMCRKPLYYKGMYKHANQLQEEWHTKQLDALFFEVFDMIFDVFDDESGSYSSNSKMFYLSTFEYNFNRLKKITDNVYIMREMFSNGFIYDVLYVEDKLPLMFYDNIHNLKISKKKNYIVKKGIYNISYNKVNN